MTSASDPAVGLDHALRRVHRSVLLLLAFCAAVVAAIAATSPGAAPGGPGRGYALTAIGLAVASILARSLPGRTGGRGAVYGALASLLCGGAIGLVAVAVAWAEGQWKSALLYAAAAALLTLRPPRPLALRPPAERAEPGA